MRTQARPFTILSLMVTLLFAGCRTATQSPLPTLAPTAPSIPPTIVTAAVTPLSTATTTSPPISTETAVPPTVEEEPTALPQTPSPFPTPPPASNVVLIIVDSLRADHVSSYGYSRPTTPNLDAWMAAQGMQFNHVVSSSSWTCPSNAAIMTGRSPSSLNSTWATTPNAVPQEAHTLAEYLHETGYYTAGFVNNSCISSRAGFSQGFDHYDDSVTSRERVDSYNQVDAEEVNAMVLNWLETSWRTTDAAQKPLFLFIYYMDPHVLYDPPPPYDTLYDPDYTGPFTTEVFGVGREVLEGSLVPSERDVQHIQALYDGEISYWDSQFGMLMNSLEGYGILDDSLVIVTADHGEMFGEHNTWVHGTSLYEGVIRVPLLIRYPNAIIQGQTNFPVQSMDIMPTVLDMVGLPVPTDIAAVSLRPVLVGQEMPLRDIYSEVDMTPSRNHWSAWIAPETDLRSIERDGWKLIHHIGQETADELYQLQPVPPYEVDNVLEENATLANEMRQRALDWFRR